MQEAITTTKMLHRAVKRLFVVDGKPLDRSIIRLSQSGWDPRYRVLSALGWVREDLSDLGFYFWFGHMVEEAVLKVFIDLYKEAHGLSTVKGRLVKQKAVKNGLGDTGHIDLFLVQEEIVVEVKSTSDMDASPKRDHILQTMRYIEGTSAKMGILIYISRTDGSTKIFIIRPTAQVIKLILNLETQIHQQYDRLKGKSWEEVVSLFPQDDYWLCNLREMHRPRQFEDWYMNGIGSAMAFKFHDETAPHIDYLREAETLAWDAWVAKKNGDLKTEKKLKDRLKSFYERGSKQIMTGDIILSASETLQDSVNLKKAAEAGHDVEALLPEVLRAFRKQTSSWRTNFKPINIETEETENDTAEC